MFSTDFSNSLNKQSEYLLWLQKQLNSHFINNTLNAIQNFILENDKEKALKYLSLFGKYLNRITEYSKEQEVTYNEEIDFLNIYLELQKIRFKDKFKVNFIIDPLIKQELKFKKIPPFIVKAFLENSIEHGLLHIKNNGELTIAFKKEDDLIKITIEDNGIGIKASKSKNEWKEMTEKFNSIYLINKLLKDQVQIIELEDSTRESIGTRVILKILSQ